MKTTLNIYLIIVITYYFIILFLNSIRVYSELHTHRIYTDFIFINIKYRNKCYTIYNKILSVFIYRFKLQ